MASDIISVQQQAFLAALLSGKSIKDSAVVANVSRRTGTNWLQDASNPVRIEYERARLQAIDDLRAQSKKLNDLALKALEEFLQPGMPERWQATKMLYESQLGQVKYLDAAEALLNSDKEADLMERLLSM